MSVVTASAVNSDASGNLLQIPCNGIDGVGTDWLWGRVRWSGTITGPESDADQQMAANKLLWVDAADVNGLNVSGLYTLTVAGAGSVATATNTASRSATHSRVVVIGQVGATPTLGVGITNVPFVAGLCTAYATASQGGLGGWTQGQNPGFGYFRGSLFGGNDNIWLSGNATNYFLLIGREIDVAINGNANVYGRIGLLVSSFPSVRQADGTVDTAIAVVSRDNSPNNFKNGIMFGTERDFAHFTGALIKTTSKTISGAMPFSVPVGVDFSDATFTQAAFKSPGFQIDGAGNLILGGAVARNYADDDAAAAGGVPIDGVYHSGGVMRIRLV